MSRDWRVCWTWGVVRRSECLGGLGRGRQGSTLRLVAQFEFAFEFQFQSQSQVVVKISSTTYTALGSRQSVEKEAMIKLRVVPGANKNPRPGGWWYRVQIYR